MGAGVDGRGVGATVGTTRAVGASVVAYSARTYVQLQASVMLARQSPVVGETVGNKLGSRVGAGLGIVLGSDVGTCVVGAGDGTEVGVDVG